MNLNKTCIALALAFPQFSVAKNTDLNRSVGTDESSTICAHPFRGILGPHRRLTMLRPLNRRPVNKASAARRFRKASSRTKAANLQGLNRGGWRL